MGRSLSTGADCNNKGESWGPWANRSTELREFMGHYSREFRESWGPWANRSTIWHTICMYYALLKVQAKTWRASSGASFTLSDPPRFPHMPGARCPKDLGSGFYLYNRFGG